MFSVDHIDILDHMHLSVPGNLLNIQNAILTIDLVQLFNYMYF